MATHEPGKPNALRDHLANERTLLAWIRTSITIAGLGFVVSKFGILLREAGGKTIHTTTERIGAVVGVVLVLAGILTSSLATMRFLQTRKDIDSGLVRFSPTLDIVLAVVFGVTGIILAVYLIATS
jgi:putative membrane protein